MISWIIFAIFSAIFAALVAIFGKIGLSSIDSTLASTIRALIMSVFLVIIAWATGKFHLVNTIGSRAFYFIVLSGLAGALSWLFYFFALKIGPAPGVVAVDRLSVVFVIIFAVLFLGDKLTWLSGLGALLITAGAILMVLK